MWDYLRRIWKIKELRESLLLILLCISIFRIAAHITVPGIDPSGISDLLNSNQFLGLLNMFSGGSLENFSIVAMGLGPYITSSIIFQLLGMIFPQIEEMQKEEQGRQKINRWTRLATVPLSYLQGYGIIAIFAQKGLGTAGSFDIAGVNLFIALTAMMAGTIFLMWLGELISERHVGNGVSMIILAGIIAGVPQFIQNAVATYTSADLLNIIIFGVLTIITVLTVVIMNEAQRNIPVQYARGNRGGASQKVSSSIPMRINMGGMIPIIFAVAIIVFPPLIAQYFQNARTAVLQDVATFTIQLFNNQLFYVAMYFILVFAFTFFYASVIYKPENIAENLQKQGGFIPGIRPGVQTATYLNWVKNRVLLLGAIFLSTIAVLPIAAQQLTGTQNLIVGGSSVIIVVSVVIDMLKQVESQVTMRKYEIS
ncbi:MAG: preprotein translocase subunit SecY [Patescibacteria group bacterium]|jgi:preprotein translocase subunit SecY